MGRANSRPPARVACLVAPHWPLQVVARADPTLLTRPVVVTQAGAIVAVSPPAAAMAVRVGLTVAEAQARCPTLVQVPAAPEAAAALLDDLWPTLDRVSATVEMARPGVFFLDWSGLTSQADGEARLARRLAARLVTTHGLTVQMGIADGPFTAAVAARHRARPDQPAWVAPGLAAAFLAPFDIAVLPGIQRLVPRLRALGLRAMGDLARLPLTALTARFGEPIQHAHRLARGQDARPLRPRQPPAERTVTLTFDPPEIVLDRLLFAAIRALRPTWDDLETQGLIAEGLRLVLTLADGEVMPLVVALPGTTRAALVASDALRARLGGVALPAPVAGLTLTLLGVGPATARQRSLLEAGRAGRRPRQFEAVARLAALVGAPIAQRLAVRPALVPEGAVTARPWDDQPAPMPPPAAPVVVALPGLPGLRRIVPPRPVQVLLEAGRPAALRDGAIWWRVAAVEGPARAVTDWWTTGQATIDRDYYLVADEAGRVVVLVEDRLNGGWRLVGEID